MKKLVWVIPILFLIDNVLGTNGHQFAIFGVGIRTVLFLLSALILCIYCLYTVKKQQMSLLQRTPGRPCLLDYCKPLDGFVAGFLVLNGIWATVIPVIKGGSFSFAYHDVNTLLVLVLYFPLVFLIRTKQLDLKAIFKWLYPLLLILALWHTVMYIGEVLSPGFYMGYYDLIDKISFGTAVRTDIVQGYGITRVIQTTSVLLMPAIFLTLEESSGKLKFLTVAAAVLTMFAILITYTKSIWFGTIAGFLVAVAGILIFAKDACTRKRTLAFFGAMVACFCVFNFVFLNNTIITRTKNSTRPNSVALIEAQIAELQNQLKNQMQNQQNPQPGTQPDSTADPTGTDPTTEGNKGSSHKTLAQQLEELEKLRKDAAGTAEANAKRSQQNRALLKKWSGSKLLGYGYGAYTPECIRNEEHPFMYESLFPALLMKLGVLGLLGWGVFVVALVLFAIKALWKKPATFWCWLGTALAYAMAVQTNPLLFTFAGWSLMLYLLLLIAGAQEEQK